MSGSYRVERHCGHSLVVIWGAYNEKNDERHDYVAIIGCDLRLMEM